ncbi:MAG: hypothetical protein AABY49_00170 [Planctomycetota bacterium]
MEDFKEQKRRLREKSAFVGLTEKFDESIVAMSMLFEWNIQLYNKKPSFKITKYVNKTQIEQFM